MSEPSPSDRTTVERGQAAALGINEAYISLLVERFYEAVRVDPALGPVFAAAIGADWTPHLATMKRFWSSVALGTGVYEGRPVPAHARHRDITPEHFERWLVLFRETLEETAPCPDAADFFLERAARIGKSLKLALFGLPGLARD
ncbi:group III truncated hemoglobin [Parvularcula sp. LCG005]|uniref:group III truncated hemoglobin n=1 Tax=Parvularcula sp. LCG005 TaxID=3078805 RepID=UPI002941F49F|nr:group III truncated hemoglobin [Parvularcula sp. LCG005]WOI53906.1 group III truncated hemoglobin [Parvularcula sp. LCG005]